MASSRGTKLRIAASVLFATGFWDAIAGRFTWQRLLPPTPSPIPMGEGVGGRSLLRDLKGAVHIHSNYSDGLGDVPTVMEAARETGMDWLLLTDHNTQKPLRDNWESKFDTSPLLLIGTEVTVEKGAFLLALDMPPAWEPTRHQPPQVAINEVSEHGGLPLISLPFDVKHPWRDWDATGCEGLEVINLSTIARRHINLLSLLWLWPVYRTRGVVAAMTALVTRPDQAIARWDAMMEGGAKPSVGLGALDAHALTKIGREKYPFPTYAETFQIVTTHVLLPPTETGHETRRAIYDALRKGRCYIAYDCVGDPAGLTFTGTNADGHTVVMGERVNSGGKPVVLSAHLPEKRTLIRLYHNGRIVAAGLGGVVFTASKPGAYRVEAYKFAGRLGPLFLGIRPWVFTNPIYVNG